MFIHTNVCDMTYVYEPSHPTKPQRCPALTARDQEVLATLYSTNKCYFPYEGNMINSPVCGEFEPLHFLSEVSKQKVRPIFEKQPANHKASFFPRLHVSFSHRIFYFYSWLAQSAGRRVVKPRTGHESESDGKVEFLEGFWPMFPTKG